MTVFLQNYRLINPDSQIAEGFSGLLEQYPYLQDHLADALIAATAWKKGLTVMTTNPRHFTPIVEIQVKRFPRTPPFDPAYVGTCSQKRGVALYP